MHVVWGQIKYFWKYFLRTNIPFFVSDSQALRSIAVISILQGQGQWSAVLLTIPLEGRELPPIAP